MYSAYFSLKTLKISLFILLGGLLVSCYHRAEHFDDAWFAEQSYWLVQDGRVRSEFFRGLNGWGERIYIFHKFFIYAGAFVMSMLGFSLESSKLLTTVCAGIAGWLIWQYGHRVSREYQWTAIILYFGCGIIIRYFSINRPEIMCMTLGLGSYLAIDRPSNKVPKASLAGGLAGLAALTHLNGLIYLISGAIWLCFRMGWSPAIRFSIAGGAILCLYGLDALLDGHFDTMISQFTNDPATQSSFRLMDKLTVMINYHQLFFHSHGEIPLTVLLLLCLLVFKRSIQFSQPVVFYLVLLVVTFWLLTKSNFDFYYILFVPWFAIIVATCIVRYLPERTMLQQKIAKGLLVGYYGLSLFCIGKVLAENYKTPYLPVYNSLLAQHMPQHHTKIIAPISFFFGQIENYQIHGLSYYYISNHHKPFTVESLLQQADHERVKYVIVDGYLSAGYFVSLNSPGSIGFYRRIFRNKMTAIYEHI